LRAALVVSASKDRQITLIEVIQNYPTKEVEVEGVDAFAPRLVRVSVSEGEEKRLVARHRLEAAYRQLRRLQGNLQDILGF
jgi:Alpha/beta hydrolase of unknown function (DUF1400)